MAQDPKLKFTLEVDDSGRVKFKRFGQDIEEVGRAGGIFGAKFDGVNRSVESFSSRAEQAALRAGALGAALAVAAGGFIIKESLEKFSQFETAALRMGNVTSESIESIKSRIRELPPELGTATDLIKGYYQVISAGVTEPVKAIDLLTVASKMANESHIEQGEAVKGLSKLMAGYGDEMKNATQAADLLYTMEKAGQTSVAELIPLIGGLSKQSRDLGISQDELGASFAQMTQFAGSSEQAATQYQAVLTALNKPTTEMKEALKSLGYETAESAIQTLGFKKTMEGLILTTGGSSQKLAELFARVEAVKGVSAMADKDFAGFNERLGAMTQKTGALDDAWSRFTSTLEATGETLENQVANILIEIGEEISPSIKRAGEELSVWLDQNKEMLVDTVAGIVETAKETVKNMNISGADVKEFVESVVNILGGMYTVAEKVAWWFNAVGTGIGVAIAKANEYEAVLDKNKEKQLQVMFMGMGSTKKPITEKIDEITEKIGKFGLHVESIDPELLVEIKALLSNKSVPFTEGKDMLEYEVGGIKRFIEAANPKLKIDTNDALKATDKLKDAADNTAESIARKYPSFKINTDPAMSALQDVADTADKVASKIQNMTRESAGVALKIFKPKDWETALKVASEDLGWIEDSKLYFGSVGGYQSSVRSLHQQLNKWAKEFGITEYEIPGFAGTYRTYQSGTGSSGLPYTGLFMGHEGEIVLNKKESDVARRSGGVGGATTINITISPMYMTGDRQSISAAVDGILPEIKRKLNRLGDYV